MSKFDYGCFYGDFSFIAVSKEKYTKDQAVEIAKIELGLTKDERPCYLCIEDGFVRHRAGVDVDGEPRVCWWLEWEEHKRSCPVWAFNTRSKVDKYIMNNCECILLE